jgi:membrane associated rhomboid family serine protease
MNSVNELTTRSPAEAKSRAPKPKLSAYGYQGTNENVYPCSREELIAKVRSLNLLAPAAKLVWTPEVETLVEPYEIPYLFAPYKQRLRKIAFLKIVGSAAILAGCFFLTQRFPYGLLLLPLMFVIVPGFLFLWDGVQTLVRLKELQPEAVALPISQELAPEEVKRLVHLQTLRLTWTKDIMACLMTVGALQLLAEESIYAAGLVKPAVWDGEVWRLLTAGMLHGGLIHFWVNFGSLTWLGRMIEAFTHRAYLPIVFFLSVLSGSLFSLFFTPGSVSVGASGGLLGLIGFLVIVGWRHKTAVPANFFQNLLLNLALIAVVGFIGRSFIDNAGHLGGLLSGLLLGFWLIPAPDLAGQFLLPEKVLRLSQVFRGLIVITAIVTSLLMFRENLLWGGVLLLFLGTISFIAVKTISFFDRY